MNESHVQLEYTNKVRELCFRLFMPPKKLSDGSINPEDHPALRAEVIHASNCMTSLARIFKAIDTQHSSFYTAIIVDLSFGLSENPFWKQHSGVLVPVYKSVLHAAITAKVIEMQDPNSPLHRKLSTQWYSLFLIAFDCLYGAARTLENSFLIMQELEVNL